jgi:oligoendopeptidase F
MYMSITNGLVTKLLVFLAIIVAAGVFLAANLTSTEKDSKGKPTFENTVLEYEKRIADADYYWQVIAWNTYLHSDDEGLAKLVDIYEKNFWATINDEENFKRIKELRDQYIKDNVKGEKRDITEKWYKYLDRFIVLDPKAKKLQEEEVALRNKLSMIWNVYRPKMKGKDGKFIKDAKTGKDKLFNQPELIRIISTGKDRNERKEAFEAFASIGNSIMTAGFRDLVKLRNEFAKTRGYKDFYNMQYSFKGQDEDKTFQMFDKIITESDPITKKAVAKFMADEKIDKFEPWDYEYASQGFTSLIDGYLPAESTIPALKASYKNLGIDLDKLNIKMDLESRPGKYPHAVTFWCKCADLINGKWTGEDIRFMASVDKGGLDQYNGVFHETGHAVHASNVKQKYVIDKDVNLTYPYEMGAFTEGIAMTFERLNSDPDWFIKYADFNKPNKSQAELQEIKKAFAAYEAKSKPWDGYFTRKLLSRVYFERSMYKNPDADYNKLWWDSLQKILLVERHDNLAHWGHKSHWIGNPGMYQDYVIADLISAQNVHYFKKKFGKFADEPNVGRELAEKYLNPGNTIQWEQMIVNLTGEKLNPQYRIDEMTKF